MSDTMEISDSTALSNAPLVSVYMLAYRHEKFIAQAIEGVIAQQCDFPIEFIIGEDCSPDRTREIVLDYQRRYPHLIRVLISDTNVGAFANARRCQVATRGEYVATCEGDDFWHHPKKLQMQVEMMSADPAMVFCHTDFDRKTRFRTWHNKHKNYPSPWLAQGNAYLALLHEWSVMTATTMMRRNIFLKFWGTEFDNPNWPFGDRNRLLFASRLGAAGYIDQSTATFRKVVGSAGNRTNASHLKLQLAGEECIVMFLDRYPVDGASQREIRGRLKAKIYHAAFYAERKDVMQSSHAWLLANGFTRSDLAHRMRLVAVASRLPIRLMRAAKNFIDLRISAIAS